MVRRRSTVRFRKGAPPADIACDYGWAACRLFRVRAGSPVFCPRSSRVCSWRSSSVRQSKRLIIAVSPVQVRPPLPPRRSPAPSAVRRGMSVQSSLSRKALPSGCHRRTAKDHAGLPGVQASELHHAEEPAQRPGPHGAEEVLPQLPQAPGSPRDPLASTDPRSRASPPISSARPGVLPGRAEPRSVTVAPKGTGVPTSCRTAREEDGSAWR
jgi:hypothetical protein